MQRLKTALMQGTHFTTGAVAVAIANRRQLDRLRRERELQRMIAEAEKRGAQ